ncbi:hypothetical protein vseg_017808 [Gypsophila vaccaria]
MVEVEVGKEFPEKVSFRDETGTILQVAVEYEWKPITCGNCHRIGHHMDQCRKRDQSKPPKKVPQKVWRPMQKPVIRTEGSLQTARQDKVITVPSNNEKEGGHIQGNQEPNRQDGYSNHSFEALSYKEILSPTVAVQNGETHSPSLSYG